MSAAVSKSWFSVDKDGLAKLLSDRRPGFVLDLALSEPSFYMDRGFQTWRST